MTWAHITEEGIIDWISDVEQKGLVQLDLPVLESNEQMRLVNGAVVVEKENAGEDADAVLSSFIAELEEAKAQSAEQETETPQALTEEQLQELPEEARQAYLSAQEAQAEQAKPPPFSPMLLFRLLDPDTALPANLFHGWSYSQAHEFTGDFGEWVFLNCEPTEKQKAFISDYAHGRKLDALFLTCPFHGQRVSFSDILIGTDKVMLHKDILAELEAAGIATSGLEFRAALFKNCCTAHCGVFLNDELEKAVPSEAQALTLADAALSLLNAGEETLALLKEGI